MNSEDGAATVPGVDSRSGRHEAAASGAAAVDGHLDEVAAVDGRVDEAVAGGAQAAGDGGLDEADYAAVAAQLGRPPRGAVRVAHRCGCGLPDVVETTPRLPDGTPFPTTYYLTCPRAVAECSRLESAGVMTGMSERLATDEQLAARYRAAHDDYLARRRAIGDVPEIDGVSAGGMPDRVKCLHVQLGHTLAAGGGINPIGDETLALIRPWWRGAPCVSPPDTGPAAPSA